MEQGVTPFSVTPFVTLMITQNWFLLSAVYACIICSFFHLDSKMLLFFPQIAIAIGVLTSNKGEGDEPFWQIGRGTKVPLQRGEWTWCHCRVPL